MALTDRRNRPGHSRRAQLGTFLGFLAAIGAIVAGLVLVIMSRSEPDLAQDARVAMTEVTTPATRIFRWPLDRVTDAFGMVHDYLGAVSRARALEAAGAAAQRNAIRLQQLERENRRLAALLGLKSPTQRRVATATIVGATPTSFVRSAILAVGRQDGVRPGQPVRAVDGLVGRIVEAGPHTARVLLLTDPQSRVPVMLLRSGGPAIAAGNGAGRLEVRPIEADRNPFRKGDILVTSGIGGTFAPDIPVAVVISLDAEGAIARPLAAPERLREVIVETPYIPQAPALTGAPAEDGTVP